MEAERDRPGGGRDSEMKGVVGRPAETAQGAAGAVERLSAAVRKQDREGGADSESGTIGGCPPASQVYERVFIPGIEKEGVVKPVSGEESS